MTTPRLPPERLRRLLRLLRPDVGGGADATTETPTLYVLLDAARDAAVYRALYDRQADLKLRSLYQGDPAEQLAEVAPYLVQLEPDAGFTEWLLERGWGQSWAVFVRSLAPFDELRRHFRKFTVIHTDDGKSLMFRFYDPRVLRMVLPTASPAQLKQMFGEVVERYVVEGEDGVGAMEYAWIGGEVRVVKWDG